MVALDTEDRGRRRRTYALTDRGRTALREWLAAPMPEHFEMRDVAELKDMVARHGDDDWAQPRMITLELGLEMEHAALRFWAALADGNLDRLRRERDTRRPHRPETRLTGDERARFGARLRHVTADRHRPPAMIDLQRHRC